jgi:hypothetical protein
MYQQVWARGLALSVTARAEAQRDWRHGNLATIPIKHQLSISASASFIIDTV